MANIRVSSSNGKDQTRSSVDDNRNPNATAVLYAKQADFTEFDKAAGICVSAIEPKTWLASSNVTPSSSSSSSSSSSTMQPMTALVGAYSISEFPVPHYE